MKAFLGPYAMTREGSGTSWVPDTTPHEGVHGRFGEWSTMWHGYLNLIYDRQGGPRGANKTFVNGMVMGMAQRPLGDGTLGVRAMLSPDPFMGKNGYPLLLASGETADGRTHLIDRQHPHDLFMELAGTYSHNLSATSSVFLYAGLPGEPALGPPAFMHRTSGVDIPEAPITSGFGARVHPIFHTVRMHTGLDFGAGYGTPIRAGADGTVVKAGSLGGYGNATVIDHGRGMATLYGHQSRILVHEGQTVKRGEVIGLVGATGFATGPHLHFEVRIDGTPVDPRPYL